MGLIVIIAAQLNSLVKSVLLNDLFLTGVRVVLLLTVIEADTGEDHWLLYSPLCNLYSSSHLQLR